MSGNTASEKIPTVIAAVLKSIFLSNLFSISSLSSLMGFDVLANDSLAHSDADSDELKKYFHITNLILGISESDTTKSSDSFGDITSFVDKTENEYKDLINDARIDYKQLHDNYENIKKYLEESKTDSSNFKFSVCSPCSNIT